jgi:outer membrane receptor for ferrienterochelin and colicins
MTRYICGLVLLCALVPYMGMAQWTVKGQVLDRTDGTPLVGASVQWQGEGNITDENGYFEVIFGRRTDSLEVSYVGYAVQVVALDSLASFVRVELVNDAVLTGVEIKTKQAVFSTLKTQNTEAITAGQLRRSPCCNLGESFETSAAASVVYADAVTGIKEIQMLGLRGIYTQLMVENRPTFGGLATPYALEYVPGSWLSGVQISKGTGTVVNGSEGITAQINTELVKPICDERFFLNLFGTHLGRMEANAHVKGVLGKHTSAVLLGHADVFNQAFDKNNDGFMDMALRKQYNGMARLLYMSDESEVQANVQYIHERRLGGEMGATLKDFGDMPTGGYYVRSSVDRVEAFGKASYLKFDKPYKSIGLVWGATWHNQAGDIGSRSYMGTEKSGYANVIYETIVANEKNKLRLGMSQTIAQIAEQLGGENFDRRTGLTGAFVQHTYDADRLVVMTGLRMDYAPFQHRLFVTPRVNVKYNFNEESVIRMSAGSGVRYPNMVADNIGILVTNRDLIFADTLLPEVAWNYGINFTQHFPMFGREGSVSADVYRTDFVQQFVVDMDSSSDAIYLGYSTDASYSNTGIVTLIVEPLKGWEVKTSYTLTDVRQTTDGQLQQKLGTALHRGFVNMGYQTPNEHWRIDGTLFVNGSMRMHTYHNVPDVPDYLHSGKSPAYLLLNGQVTYKLKNWEWYVGAENITGYQQPSPIVSTPNLPTFDATQVYAPIVGQIFFAGLRYSLLQKNN